MKRFTQYKNYRWMLFALIFAMLVTPQLTHAYAAVFNSVGVVADDVTDQCDLSIEQTYTGIGVWAPHAIEMVNFDAMNLGESLQVPEAKLDSWNPGPGESHSALIADMNQLYQIDCNTPANGGTGSGVAGETSIRDVRPWLDYVLYDQDSNTTMVQIAYPTTMLANESSAYSAMWYNPAGSPQLESIMLLHDDRLHGDLLVDHTIVQYHWKGNVAANFSFLARYDGTFGAIYTLWQRNDMALEDGTTLDTTTWGPDNPNGAIMPAMDDIGDAIMFNPATPGQTQLLFLPIVTQGVSAGSTIPQQ